MKVKTSELTGAALDWAVAKCEGKTRAIRLNKFKQWEDHELTQVCDDDYTLWNPSEDWSQGGPIIERQEIELVPKGMHWDAYADEDSHVPYPGPTPLIAAMRCYVASKLGDEVEIPEELK